MLRCSRHGQRHLISPVPNRVSEKCIAQSRNACGGRCGEDDHSPRCANGHLRSSSNESEAASRTWTMDTDVLIVGAGPTGLMLANQLARRGVRIVIIDRHAGPSLQTRALGVQARTLEIYSQL